MGLRGECIRTHLEASSNGVFEVNQNHVFYVSRISKSRALGGGVSRASGGSGNTNVHSTTPRPLVTICFPRSLLLSSERTEFTLCLSAGIFSATGAGEAANSDLQVRERFIGGETVEGIKKNKRKKSSQVLSKKNVKSSDKPALWFLEPTSQGLLAIVGMTTGIFLAANATVSPPHTTYSPTRSPT